MLLKLRAVLDGAKFICAEIEKLIDELEGNVPDTSTTPAVEIPTKPEDPQTTAA